MNPVPAAQHVYTNVEAEHSPRRRGGLQTLLHTHAALTDEEIEEIEPRLLYFRSASNPAKHLNFTLPGGKQVISQIVFLPGTDRLGREGRYLAHSLVFQPGDFAALGGNALAVLAVFPFFTSVEAALAQGNGATGDLPSAAIPVSEEASAAELRAALSWPRAELPRLALLALQAANLRSERRMVALVGRPEEARQAIQAALASMPLALRAPCTFDTFFDGCNPIALQYWAVGLSAPPQNRKFIVVDARAQSTSPEAVLAPATTYERWVVSDLETRGVEFVARHRESAFALCEELDGQPVPSIPTAEVEEELQRSILAANPTAAESWACRRLGEIIAPDLIPRLIGPLFLQQSAARQWQTLRQGFQRTDAVAHLKQVYAASGFARPGDAELKAVDLLAAAADDRDLRLLCACWSQDAARLNSLITPMTEDDYQQFVKKAFRHRLTDLLMLVEAGKGEALLRACATVRPLNTDELTRVHARLVKIAGRAAAAQVLQEAGRRGELEFRRFLETALHPGGTPPAELLVPGRERLLVECYVRSGLAPVGLLELVERLLTLHQPVLLDRLIPVLQSLSPDARRTLIELIARQKEVPGEFVQALSAPASSAPPPVEARPGVFGRIKSLFRRSGEPKASKDDGTAGGN